jgi:hypothetical protein
MELASTHHQIEDQRLQKQILKYLQSWRRWLECPCKRQLDDMNAENKMGQPNGLTSWLNDDEVKCLTDHWILLIETTSCVVLDFY